MNVFTYGSLMFGEVWQPLAGKAYASMAAELVGYVRQGVANERYPGIRAERGAVTPGRVYLGIDAQTLARLDSFEGSEYRRVPVSVTLRGRPGQTIAIDAQVYVLVDHSRLDGQPWDPNRFRNDDAADFYRAHSDSASNAGFTHP